MMKISKGYITAILALVMIIMISCFAAFGVHAADTAGGTSQVATPSDASTEKPTEVTTEQSTTESEIPGPVITENIHVLNYTEVNMFPGQILQLKVEADGVKLKNIVYTTADSALCKVSKYGVLTAAKKQVYIKQAKTTDVTVSYTYTKDGKKYQGSETCKVNVFVPNKLDVSQSPIGVGKKLKANYEEIAEFTETKVEWISTTPDYATVSQKGYIKGIKEGPAVIKRVYTCGERSFTTASDMTITNPQFANKINVVSLYKYQELSIRDYLTGLNDFSRITNLKTSNKSAIKVNKTNLTILPLKKAGKVTISCTVDGVPIKTYFYVSTPRISNAVINKKTNPNKPYYEPKPVALTKGKSYTVKLYGLSKKSTYSYKSDNKSVATISKQGVIKAKKNGTANITVTIDNQEYKFLVVVDRKKVVDVINRAIAAVGCTYSQPKRMMKGYYDCSSLVWRCYSPSGITFGVPTWAPTADAECISMANQGKIVSWKGVSYKKLKPGDIIFFGGYYSWQYRTIGHVAIYIGGDTIIHASGGGFGVIVSNYTARKSRVAGIARPF